MVTPPGFIDLSDEEAYEEASERLTCDYCNYKYFSRKSLNKPIEVYSSQRKVKRWVCVCLTCMRAIESYERKMIRKRNNMDTGDYLCYEDNEAVLKREEGGKEERSSSSSSLTTRHLEDHEF